MDREKGPSLWGPLDPITHYPSSHFPDEAALFSPSHPDIFASGLDFSLDPLHFTSSSHLLSSISTTLHDDGHNAITYDNTGAFGGLYTNQNIGMSECGSPNSDNDTYAGALDADHHSLFADFPMSLLSERTLEPHHQRSQSSYGGPSQLFSAFEYDMDTHIHQISFNQAPTVASSVMHPTTLIDNLDPNIFIDSDTSLAEILDHDNYTISERGTSPQTVDVMDVEAQYEHMLAFRSETPRRQAAGSGNTNSTENRAGTTADTNRAEAVMDGDTSAENTPSTSSDEAWPCEYNCGKFFRKKFLRNKHHKVHAPPHACTFCAMRFPVKRDKMRHIRDRHRTEAGIVGTPYFCTATACKRHTEQPFTRRDNMLRHVRKQHPRDKEAFARAIAARGEQEEDDVEYLEGMCEIIIGEVEEADDDEYDDDYDL